jgi:cytochrome c553
VILPYDANPSRMEFSERTPMAAAMIPSVEKLSVADMIALAAYARSLTP